MRFEIMNACKVKLCASLFMWLGIVTWIRNVKLHLWFVFVQQSTERDVVCSVANEQVNISKRHAPVNARLRDGKTFSILDNAIEHRVFWSSWLDGLSTRVFGVEHERKWREQVRDARVVVLEAGCGRPTNRLATFADGTRACVRYGIDADQVLGETLSYYLAELLGISNLPPLALSKLNLSSEQWASVRGNIEALEWSPNAIVSLTEFIPNVTGVFIPLHLRKQQVGGLQLSAENISNMTVAYLVELMQWSDLIIFDYLTANFDRIVSHIFSLQWDARVMERTTNNLLKTINGHLLFIDNEAGLVHGYRVLDLWERYHRLLLASSCIFRRSTVRRVSELKRSGNSAKLLCELYRAREPLARELGSLSEEHALTLQNRIDVVYKHIKQCAEIM
ncbi:four-jointed box protein 1-like [Sinocyclocheilus anshuiensis]|uniref:Four-jointed box protein 1-like n=1 Tax=Sinocyclocheilus anshuiensis TaxID=1608454 RepID=A0A671P2F9_9TELE|nr:PREDICTED: four-jointed box protein 1-like [Sinocyclocheilus anshuiensis]